MSFKVFLFLGLFSFCRSAVSKAELAVALSHIFLLKPVKVAADGMSGVQMQSAVSLNPMLKMLNSFYKSEQKQPNAYYPHFQNTFRAAQTHFCLFIKKLCT